MSLKSYTLAYVLLVVLLAMTILLPFQQSLYVYATLKAGIIFFVFMHALSTEKTVKLYLVLAVFLVTVLVVGVLDDQLFRPVIMAD